MAFLKAGILILVRLLLDLLSQRERAKGELRFDMPLESMSLAVMRAGRLTSNGMESLLIPIPQLSVNFGRETLFSSEVPK